MKRRDDYGPITRQSVLDLLHAGMQERGWGVTRLEREAGVPGDTVRDFERGKAYLMRPDKLQKVLNALGYDLVITSLKRK